MVAADVRDGLITAATARDAYGVAIDPASFDVDRDATAGLRGSAYRPGRQ
jgi:hypothetical protein